MFIMGWQPRDGREPAFSLSVARRRDDGASASCWLWMRGMVPDREVADFRMVESKQHQEHVGWCLREKELWQLP